MEPKFIVIDLFCGAGGTTTGFVMTGGESLVAACVNHDATAIKSHWANNPEVEHFEEDITKLYGYLRYGILFHSPEFLRLKKLIELYRALYPNAKIILWASLECTNFSKAKGGQARDADSRTLADHLHYYIEALKPDYIKIENVVEFMSWGPMKIKCAKKHADRSDLVVMKNRKGQLVYGWEPLSKKNGLEWTRWCKAVCKHGYYDDWKELNSADFGAYTSRNRLFGIFAKHDLPIAWPDVTHYNPKKNKKVDKKQADLFNIPQTLLPWNPVKHVLDFTDEGESIFNRKKPLSDKTLARIYAGLEKYVAKGDTSFLSKNYSGRPAGKVTSTNDPCGVLTTFGGPSLVQPEFLVHYYGTGANHSSVHVPCTTLTARDGKAFVTPKFFIQKFCNGSHNHQSIEQPAGALMPNDKHCLMQCEPFIMPTNYNNPPLSINDPAPSLLASRRHHYIINPSHGGCNSSIEKPCPVLIARQDKAPLYLLQATEGKFSIPIYDGDSEMMIKIKQFMAAFGLVDIKMRMLRVLEMLNIQGFPKGTKLEGNQNAQKKQIGNSVVPVVVMAWSKALGKKVSMISKAA